MPLPDLKPHPLAELTPEMTGEQFRRLMEDVVVNGVKQPITLYEGMILDGVNRYRAAKAAGRIEIPTEIFEGSKFQALQFITSRNQHRRHMNESQRALLAARVFKIVREQFADERLASDLADSARRVIERPDRADHVIWPPAEGFPASAPEALRAFARDHGVENVAMDLVGDARDFDNSAARAEAQKLVRDGYIEESDLPKDEPDPNGPIERFSAQRNAADNFGPARSKNKRGRGRPKNEALEFISAGAKVTKSMAKRVDRIERKASAELKTAVERGEVSVSRAAEIAALPKAEQAAAISSLPEPDYSKQVPKLLRLMSDISDKPASIVKQLGPEKSRALADAARRLASAVASQIGESVNG